MGEHRYKVWGFTARILVEAAQIAYDEEPEFEHSKCMGNEDIISTMVQQGDFTLQVSQSSFEKTRQSKAVFNVENDAPK